MLDAAAAVNPRRRGLSEYTIGMNAVHEPLCPRCRIPLTPGRARNVILHACGQCGGVWLDNTCASRMVQAYEADALAMADQAAKAAPCPTDTSMSGIPCAACDTPMQQRCVCGVDIDICSQHGTWFDPHELRKVAEAMAQSRRQQFQQSQGATPTRSDSGRVAHNRPRAPGSATVTGDEAFMVGYVAADAADMGGDAVGAGMDVADMGADALSAAGDVAGGVADVVADGGVDIVASAFELVGGILGGLFDL